MVRDIKDKPQNPPKRKGGIAMEQHGTVSNSHPLFVDYDLLVEDAIKLGCYDWVNSNITAKNFSTQRTEKADVKVELVHFNRVLLTKDVLEELDRMGYRPAELHELLAFGEKYPDIQKKFPIVALGSVWQYQSGGRGVPCLYWGGSGRFLGLGWVEGDWYAIYRFAAVRK